VLLLSPRNVYFTIEAHTSYAVTHFLATLARIPANFLFTYFNPATSAAPQIPLVQKTLGLNP
jgi:hypothetical protein